MTKGFWGKLSRPITALAPMADVTDPAYRRIIARIGKPDVLWTEFVSADGLVLADPGGKQKLLADLIYTQEERPILAQLFSGVPKRMEEASRLAEELGFDGIDINMGCPDRSIEKQYAGALLIKDSALATEIVEAAQKGASSLPVSVKTRIGYSHADEFDDWAHALLSMKLPALTLHARTRKELSKEPAQWEYVERLVSLRDDISPETLILGNGDVLSMADAKNKIQETGCDGVMFGRAIFGNPWLFSEHKPTKEEKLETLVELAHLFEELLPHKHFAIFKKHIKAFVEGWSGAGELRGLLMEGRSADELERIMKDHRASHISANVV